MESWGRPWRFDLASHDRLRDGTGDQPTSGNGEDKANRSGDQDSATSRQSHAQYGSNQNADNRCRDHRKQHKHEAR